MIHPLPTILLLLTTPLALSTPINPLLLPLPLPIPGPTTNPLGPLPHFSPQNALLATSAAPNLLSPCAQPCISSILTSHKPWMCNQGDVACYCTKPNFGYAIRDCSAQMCGAGSKGQESALEYGSRFCGLVEKSEAGCTKMVGGVCVERLQVLDMMALAEGVVKSGLPGH